ncbi:hypothetical protein RJ639_046773 [Escallonia herrerae]|uniref:E3 ubiquitin-protein ligase listerin n=1 Tax=Escallonia herrerae TaxID=1293975 RepID=A0AA88WIC2_9ASTE|nr:hypothetical protein RJ639_046773 [Escallonia herrerae]
MGRQKGEAARTKARPSSSSLAASLVPSGAAAVGFGGFVGSSRLDASLASVDASPDIDGEVSQYLKRLGRKDPTTKLKALASLSGLLKQKSAKEVLAIVPQWVQLRQTFEYKKLLLDDSREVRRATHETMTNLILVVGRDLALHLKSLMGPWWFSQFDPVYEVSQAAKRSLQVAFPAEEKRLDALLLCTNEVFMYLEDNLKLTWQIMSDKAVALDELQEMHQQVISSSLQALATLLDVVVCLHLERPGFENISSEPKHASKARATATSYAEKLFSVHKCYLDFLKSQSPAIRSATYSVLTSYIKNIPHAFNERNMKVLGTAILGAFQEKDPACHSSMWEAILLFSRKFPDSWTTVNVQKTVLNRVWNFLRNGCFGSQQVSYPALVLFLDSMPPTAILGEKFFLEFFQNLWAGRNPPHSSNKYPFLAFKECFLWGLQNASRYFQGLDVVDNFRRTLVDKILLKILWHDYLLFIIPRNEEREGSGKSQDSYGGSSLPFHNEAMKTLDFNDPLGYVQNFGKCIIEILSGIVSLEPDLLLVFCSTFEENCLDIFQRSEDRESPGSVQHIIKFLLLVDQYAVQKGETWPLEHVMGPMLAKSFQLIKTLDSPETVRLIVHAASVFGPRKIVRELVGAESSSYGCQLNERNEERDLEQFLQVFKDIFIPWCLQKNSYSSSTRLDLLLALLDDHCFAEQWNSIITHATSLEQLGAGPATEDTSYISLLALLLEKIKEETRKRKGRTDFDHRQGSHPDHWHHELLDSAAVAIARSCHPFGTSHVRFFAVVGGSLEDDQTSFVTRTTLILIFEEVFMKLLAFTMDSNFTWIKDTCSSLIFDKQDSMPGYRTSVDLLAIAHFALEVLDGTFFHLKTLSDENGLVPGIFAAIFVLKWECSLAAVLNDELDDESMNKTEARSAFGESLYSLRCKMNNQFMKSLSINTRKRLGDILIQSIRCAVSKEEELDTDKFTSLSCSWMLEVLESLSQDQVEEQNFLDQFLSKSTLWPLWVMPDNSNGKRSATLTIESVSINVSGIRNVSKKNKFVALSDKLISELGINRVVAGCVSRPQTPSKDSTEELLTSQYLYPRAWLAAEMLCTWKWQGGSASSSFLPLLTAYAKSVYYSPEDSLLDSIVDILLEGALVHGGNGEMSSVHACLTSYNDLEIMEEPYLRALVALLTALYEENIWGKEKATLHFKLLLNKLIIGETLNSNCLRIFPPIMTVLIRPLSIVSDESRGNVLSDSAEGNHIHDTLEDWLQRTLSFPPLSAWQTGGDMEDLFQLVISCYPVRPKGEVQELIAGRNISSVERDLLLQLFRKQRHVAGASLAANKLPKLQMLLSELIVVAVGYCWTEFDEDDWEFVLYHMRRWIESAVVMMEEVAENVNDATTNSSNSDNLELALRNLEHSVLVQNPSPIKLARNALVAFSMFCRLLGCQKIEHADISSPLRPERWDLIKDKVLEGILRLFFSTGAAEAIASSCCYEASSIVALARLDHPHFWELVALSVVESSPHARDKAMKSVELWGLSKGPISSLYAILFSSKPVPCMQFAAYVLLSSEPVSHLAFVREDASSFLESNITDNQDSSRDMSLEDNVRLREEISYMLEKSPSEILEMDFLAPDRVNVFLAWSLLLSHLLCLPSSSPAREILVQYVQDSVNSAILDCFFQHIPLELFMAPNLKKRDAELPAGVSDVATAANHAITTNSVLFFVESLWPVTTEKMASFAGAIVGLMLRILPAYVRGWFSNIRDRSTSYAIESFTKAWCSPPLITNELTQIKKASFSDDNFSVSVSKSANEVVATYTKDETGMDLVIRLPASYPLRPVDVDCTRSLGISELKRRKWIMSMMLFIRNQNGALAEAIRIWKSNFDKEFEGVEECPICYSVIHTANHSLPRLACKTCKHKFHSACLYKWFSTSHKSTCPLCQSPF